MADLSSEQAASRAKVLLTALLLSAPGAVVTGMAAFSSHSTTQVADFVRRSIELAAMFVSWWVFRRIQGSPDLSEAGQARLERAAGLGVAAAMMISAAAMLVIALPRLSAFEPGGRVGMGLAIAVLGVVTNGWFWRRYAALTREQYSAVIDAQQKLYRAKTGVDLCVAAALAAVVIAPNHPATRYVDLLGSLLVAGYLFWTGLRMVQPHLGRPGWLRAFFYRYSRKDAN